MALTPLDIKNKSFDTKFKGYNPDDVDDFLDQVTRDYEDIVTKNREMEKSLKHAEEKLEYFNELKDALNQSIIVAQDTADKVKVSANKEAEVIIGTANQTAQATTAKAEQQSHDLVNTAQASAAQILNEASSKAKALAAETDDLKKKTRTFHQRLRLLLESQIDIVNNDDWDELLEPFSSFVGDNHRHVKEMLDKETQPKVEFTEDQANPGSKAEVDTEKGTEIGTEIEAGSQELNQSEATEIISASTAEVEPGSQESDQADAVEVVTDATDSK
ncbi:DivIVA domain-containing protein [Enterococcus timonensis]|uniref:DivIVA domain-containing protein n=1 Tax=Enterococcus timonensis TaxID=1852364 RepID=UPI0008D9A623|nr:DivIVA domain-containing protein [Enterococcus timonensis]